MYRFVSRIDNAHGSIDYVHGSIDYAHGSTDNRQYYIYSGKVLWKFCNVQKV